MTTTANLQKSPNYDKHIRFVGYFLIEGYPFNEGWPEFDSGKTFTVITRDGVVNHHCFVDHSTQYRAEGLIWRDSRGSGIYKEVVTCWIEEE